MERVSSDFGPIISQDLP